MSVFKYNFSATLNGVVHSETRQIVENADARIASPFLQQERLATGL
jgi:hypothetical protein